MAQVSTARADPHPAFDPTELASTERPAPRRGTILVVEDRDDVRQGLAQLLELHGYVVLDAPDGQHALNLLREEPGGFALMLLDLVLPGPIGGQQLRARQLADPHLMTIPTIIVSAVEPDSGRQAQLRPCAWLEKPFRFDALLEQIKKFVTPERQPIGMD